MPKPTSISFRFVVPPILILCILFAAAVFSGCASTNSDQAKANELVSQGNAIESGGQLKLAEAQMMLPLASSQLQNAVCPETSAEERVEQAANIRAAQTNFTNAQQLFTQATTDLQKAQQKFTEASQLPGISPAFSSFLQSKLAGVGASIDLSNISLKLAASFLASVQGQSPASIAGILQSPTAMNDILQLQVSANSDVNKILQAQADANAAASSNPGEIVATQVTLAPVQVQLAPVPTVNVNVSGAVSAPTQLPQTPTVP